MGGGDLRIRPARRADAAAIARLATQLARHVEDPDPGLDAARVTALGFGRERLVRFLVATRAGRVVGMIALGGWVDLHMNRPVLYVSDLAVDPADRGGGAGRALMAAAARHAVARGCAVLRWEVWRGNATALAFYERIGGTIAEEEVTVMTLEGEALARFAAV